jgi:NADH:ubiquinone oxidoreductase subunit K
MKFYKNRSFRTLLLAVVAALTFVGCAIFMFDVDPKLMLEFFILSVVGLGLLIGMALVFTVFRLLLKRWLG